MGLITALALSIGVLGGISTFLFLGPLSYIGFQIWIYFIAAATFYHCGGHEGGVLKTIVHTVFGAIVGWVTLLLVTQVPLANTIGLPLWAGICVGVMVFVLVFAAHSSMFSDIPAAVLGFAPMAGYALVHYKSADLPGALTTMTAQHPLVITVISLVAGAIFGYVTQKVAVVIATK